MIEWLDGFDDAAIDAIGNITMVCFHWTQEQVDERRPGWVERMRDPKFREKEANYLARLNGQPAGYGRVQLRGGVAYLGGAATLPEFRGKHIYSTLVHRRLEEARSRGYHLAVINAEPLSPDRSAAASRNMRELISTAGCPSSYRRDQALVPQ
jgi:GNAT superfamily N-acetyltransferase